MSQARIRLTPTSAIVALAVALRIAAIVVLRSPSIPRSTYEHGEIASNLLAGRGFSTIFLGASGPTSQQAPVYPCLVACAYAIGGGEGPRALWLLELAQAALGGVLVLGLVRLGNRLFPERRAIGLLAGLIAAVHPTLVYSATHVQVSALTAALVVWVLVAAVEAAGKPGLKGAAITGVLTGTLVLCDPILALIGVALLAIELAASRPAVALKRLAITSAAGALVLAPWLARNWLVHGEFVFIKSTFGYAFWQGNCNLSEGTDKVVRPTVQKMLARQSDSWTSENRKLWAARHEAGYIDDIALSAADRRLLGQMTEPARGRYLMARALRELRAQPGRYARLCWRRLGYFLVFDETNPKTHHLLFRVPHAALSLLAVAGLLLGARRFGRRLLPGFLFVASITTFHTLTIVSVRFHIPIEPLMALWGAVGLACAGERFVCLETQPRVARASYASGSNGGLTEVHCADSGTSARLGRLPSKIHPSSAPPIMDTMLTEIAAPHTHPK